MVMARWVGAVLGLLPVLVCGLAGEGTAEIYKWLDRDGQVHFTDDYSVVPPEYRDGVQSRPSSPPTDRPLPPASAARSKKGGNTKAPSPRLSAPGGPAKVVAVLDGDTIVIGGGDKVRYAGLN
ncbi:MAG: DUF4124 domain-containing protein, partial [Candidatus Entotheonellia bacterium]